MSRRKFHSATALRTEGKPPEQFVSGELRCEGIALPANMTARRVA
jgi:hypothetical protein